MQKGWLWDYTRGVRSLTIGVAFIVCGSVSAFAAEPIKVGLVAALSGPSAQSGEARGCPGFC